MPRPRILKNIFGQSFRICIQEEYPGKVGYAFTPKVFNGDVFALQFLLSLSAPQGYWRRFSFPIVSYSDVSTLKDIDLLRHLARMLVRGQIRFYEFPSAAENKNRSRVLGKINRVPGASSEFRQSRSQTEILYPEDKVSIPDRQQKSVAAAANQRHVFRVKGKVVECLRLFIRDTDGKCCKNTRFVCELDAVGDETEEVLEGTTNNEGLLELDLPPKASGGLLRLFSQADNPSPSHLMRLAFRWLDPVDTKTGLQARLNNLGFSCGKVDGLMQTKTTQAVRDFQRFFKLAVDGIVGPNTRAKLEAEHQC